MEEGRIARNLGLCYISQVANNLAQNIVPISIDISCKYASDANHGALVVLALHRLFKPKAACG